MFPGFTRELLISKSSHNYTLSQQHEPSARVVLVAFICLYVGGHEKIPGGLGFIAAISGLFLAGAVVGRM